MNLKKLTKEELLVLAIKYHNDRVRAGKATWEGVSPEERTRRAKEAGKKGGRPKKIK